MYYRYAIQGKGWTIRIHHVEGTLRPIRDPSRTFPKGCNDYVHVRKRNLDETALDSNQQPMMQSAASDRGSRNRMKLRLSPKLLALAAAVCAAASASPGTCTGFTCHASTALSTYYFAHCKENGFGTGCDRSAPGQCFKYTSVSTSYRVCVFASAGSTCTFTSTPFTADAEATDCISGVGGGRPGAHCSCDTGGWTSYGPHTENIQVCP